MVWSDPEVQKLAASFIPAADASDRLQSPSCRDEDAQLFQKFGGKRTIKSLRAGDGLGQGQYAVAPGGGLLASCATADPREVAQMLREALTRWDQLPHARRFLPAKPAAAAATKWRRWEPLYPSDGLVLRVITRDLPRSHNTSGIFADRWNQDFAWFRKSEAREFVPEKLAKGVTCEVPRRLMERLVRLHLIDHVRALNYAWFKPEEVEVAALRSTVIDAAENMVMVRFEGSTRAVAPGETSRGFDARLMGRATWDNKNERFSAFELIALGERWGAGNCNQRHDDIAPAPMGVALVLAGSTSAHRIAPAFISQYGW